MYEKKRHKKQKPFHGLDLIGKGKPEQREKTIERGRKEGKQVKTRARRAKTNTQAATRITPTNLLDGGVDDEVNVGVVVAVLASGHLDDGVR